jgi:hypothetical protein
MTKGGKVGRPRLTDAERRERLAERKERLNVKRWSERFNDGTSLRNMKTYGDGLDAVLKGEPCDNRAVFNLGCGSSWRRPHRHQE